MNKHKLFTKNSKEMKHSAIGELLGTIKGGEFISFAAGVPASEFFPVEKLAACAEDVFTKKELHLLQYGDTLGLYLLREKIAKRIKEKFMTTVLPEHLLITTGAQQGIDCCARLFLEKGDLFVVERPTYVDAINTLSYTGAEAIDVSLDKEGISLDELEFVLNKNTEVKLIYVIPDFQNPTGTCWSLGRRKEFMDLVSRYEVIVIEDNPYGELFYGANTMPSLKSLDKKDQVISLGSFSKLLSPGLRVGWIASSASYMDALSMVKERCDIHTSNIDQSIISAFLDKFSLDDHLLSMCEIYKRRRDTMAEAIDNLMPGCRYNLPEGGLFLWVELPEHINCMDLFSKSIEKKVAFVPGTPFYIKKNDFSHLRMNFSGSTETLILEGIKRLGEIIKNY